MGVRLLGHIVKCLYFLSYFSLSHVFNRDFLFLFAFSSQTWAFSSTGVHTFYFLNFICYWISPGYSYILDLLHTFYFKTKFKSTYSQGADSQRTLTYSLCDEKDPNTRIFLGRLVYFLWLLILLLNYN